MYLRDIRKGIGQREVFRKYINIMIKQNHNITAIEILKTIPELGRWDDIIYIWYENRENKNISDFTKDIILEQLEKDKNTDNVSLLAKWIPSENISSKNTRNIARELIKLLNMESKEYRKTLSALRKKIKIIENNLREKDYTFNYSSVHSFAMRKYSKAFIRNDEERYNKFFEDVKSGKAKLNTSVLTPFDIIREILDCAEEDIDSRKEEFDLTWKNLPNIFLDNNLNAIVACDVSGSMGISLNRCASLKRYLHDCNYTNLVFNYALHISIASSSFEIKLVKEDNEAEPTLWNEPAEPLQKLYYRYSVQDSTAGIVTSSSSGGSSASSSLPKSVAEGDLETSYLMSTPYGVHAEMYLEQMNGIII